MYVCLKCEKLASRKTIRDLQKLNRQHTNIFIYLESTQGVVSEYYYKN